MTFKFFAKQGQETQVAKLLSKFGNPTLDIQPEGVLVSVELPEGVSRRSVNRMLFQNQVVGSQSKKNRFRVLKSQKWDIWKIEEKIGFDQKFILSQDGHLKKAVLRKFTMCDCCGPEKELVILSK